MQNLRSHLAVQPQRSAALPSSNQGDSPHKQDDQVFDSQTEQEGQQFEVDSQNNPYQALGQMPSNRINNMMLPPKAKKRRITKSRGPKNPPGWDDGFSVSKGIPDYKAFNDSHAQGYMGQLKKNGGYSKYIKDVALRPGGIRPVKQRTVISNKEYQQNTRAMSRLKLETLSHQSNQRLEGNGYVAQQMNTAQKFGRNQSRESGMRPSGSQQNIRVQSRDGGARVNMRPQPAISNENNTTGQISIRSQQQNKMPMRARPPATQYGESKLVNLQAHIQTSKQLYDQIQEIWNQNPSNGNAPADVTIPLTHRTRFIEAIQELQFDVMNQILHKEILELNGGRSQIQAVQKAIQAREECIRQIRQNDAQELSRQQISIENKEQVKLPSQEYLNEMATLIQNLRQLSIHVVEQIVLWRDQIRHIFVLSTKSSQKIARKRKVQAAIQLPYLLDSGDNYLLKMRDDTLDFNNLVSEKYFNFSERNCDPFLIQTSILPKKNIVAGGGLRSLQQQKSAKKSQPDSSKIIIPLNDQMIQKAKACQEMIMYERQENVVTSAQEITDQNQNVQTKFLNALNQSQPPPRSQLSQRTGSINPNEQKDYQSPQINQINKEINISSQELAPQTVGQKSANQTPVLKVDLTPQKQVEKPSFQLPDDSLEGGPITIEPLGISAGEFPQFFENYKSKLLYEFKHSFPDDITKVMQNGYDQNYLKLTQKGELAGLVCMNIDHENKAEFRAYIKHISVLDKTKFTEVLPLVIDYAWANMYADTIRINVHHFRPDGNPDGTMGADMEIKTALSMQKKGFKWKTLINDAQGKRYQIMQINKPKEYIESDVNAKNRKMTIRQEPLTIKAAMVLRLFKQDQKDFKQATPNPLEVPYMMMSCLQKLKQEKEITALQSLDQSNKMYGQVDIIPKTLAFVGTRTQMSNEKATAYADIVSQNIQLVETNEANVSERVCTVLSTVQRLPPFDFKAINGYSYLTIRSHEEIIYYSKRQMAIIPMLDPRVQMIVLPKSQVPREMASLSSDEVIKAMMKEINESNITKLNELTMPSFKVEVQSREIDSTKNKLKIEGGNVMQGGFQTSSVEISSALPSKASLQSLVADKSSFQIDEPFIFALNDQELEMNQIENSLILAADIQKVNWIKL